MMDELPRRHFKAIYADPPWRFKTFSPKGLINSSPDKHYRTMESDDIASLPVSDIAADDCVLFLWICWPTLVDAIRLIGAWGFTYKTCAFSWIKANTRQIDLFQDDATPDMMMGYWTRSNSEVCLLATRGQPKRKNADVRQAIIEPRREHSRKPDCVRERIERLVDGPYLELFARTQRPGWTVWGNETDKFGEAA